MVTVYGSLLAPESHSSTFEVTGYGGVKRCTNLLLLPKGDRLWVLFRIHPAIAEVESHFESCVTGSSFQSKSLILLGYKTSTR